MNKEEEKIEKILDALEKEYNYYNNLGYKLLKKIICRVPKYIMPNLVLLEELNGLLKIFGMKERDNYGFKRG